MLIQKNTSPNKVGASVLSALINSENYEDAVNTLKTRYEVDHNEVKKVVDELIENLINSGLLEKING